MLDRLNLGKPKREIASQGSNDTDTGTRPTPELPSKSCGGHSHGDDGTVGNGGTCSKGSCSAARGSREGSIVHTNSGDVAPMGLDVTLAKNGAAHAANHSTDRLLEQQSSLDW